ncbi:hypothetical protein LTS18_006664 [Coniosporium uncinatum]|uniref:Uncharacterized protein n=1 Tax=Coniosporium uncinatum TaxID=93489 RepID=A0ACC3D3E5_9PEZI|nr:hypothetical protein LTS18_006664 [Coniosporium uncinatum]
MLSKQDPKTLAFISNIHPEEDIEGWEPAAMSSGCFGKITPLDPAQLPVVIEKEFNMIKPLVTEALTAIEARLARLAARHRDTLQAVSGERAVTELESLGMLVMAHACWVLQERMTREIFTEYNCRPYSIVAGETRKFLQVKFGGGSERGIAHLAFSAERIGRKDKWEALEQDTKDLWDCEWRRVLVMDGEDDSDDADEDGYDDPDDDDYDDADDEDDEIEDDYENDSHVEEDDDDEVDVSENLEDDDVAANGLGEVEMMDVDG